MSTAVTETASRTWAPRAVNVDPGAVALVATDDANRRHLTVINIGTVPVYLSPLAAVDANNAFLLPVGGGYEFTHGSPVYAFLNPAEVTAGLLNTLSETGER